MRKHSCERGASAVHFCAIQPSQQRDVAWASKAGRGAPCGNEQNEEDSLCRHAGAPPGPARKRLRPGPPAAARQGGACQPAQRQQGQGPHDQLLCHLVPALPPGNPEHRQDEQKVRGQGRLRRHCRRRRKDPAPGAALRQEDGHGLPRLRRHRRSRGDLPGEERALQRLLRHEGQGAARRFRRARGRGLRAGPQQPAQV